MFLEMPGCHEMPCIPYRTSAQKGFQPVERFHVCILANCSVSTTRKKLNATRLLNTSPRIGEGSVPPGAPPGIDKSACRDGDILLEIVVHGRRCRPRHDHHPKGECGEVADIVPNDVSLACAATFRTPHMETGSGSHLLSATCTHPGGLSEHCDAEICPMWIGFMVFGPQEIRFAPEVL